MNGKRPRKLLWQTLSIVALYFIAIAPTLSWPHISGDSEVLLVQTVLQMRHGGPWWVPMLGDQPRTNKPPLPAWITAAAVRPRTVGQLASSYPAVRESAYRWLAFELRWPALAAACITLLAAAWMAHAIGGSRYVLPTVIICGTMFLFIRFIRLATTDVYLLMWVTLANAFFASAVLQRRYWPGFVGGGIALGLALMSKGPPALVQTIVPLGLFIYARSLTRRNAPIGALLLPASIGFLAMLGTALPWPLTAVLSRRTELSHWVHELQGGGSESVSHDHWYSYISLIPNLLPWLAFFAIGTHLAATRWRRAGRLMLPLLMVCAPVFIFSFFEMRKERYLLPLAAPLAILTAHGLVCMRRTLPRFRLAEEVIWLLHWVAVLAVAIGLPLAGAFYLKRMDGTRWFSPPLAAAAVAGSVFAVVISWHPSKRYSLAPLISTAVCMLLANALFLYGWSQSASGASEMKPIADRLHAAFPNRQIVYYKPPGHDKPVTLDLDIYLDRWVPVADQPPAADGSVSALVTLREPNAAEPSAPGWKYWADLTTAKHHYHWYLLVPQ